MEKLKNALMLLFGGSAAVVLMLFQLALSLIGLCIYVWTIAIAFVRAGIISAILTALLPVASQIYWILRLWRTSGIFLNVFTVTCLIYAGLWVVPYVLVLVGAGIYEMTKRKTA